MTDVTTEAEIAPPAVSEIASGLPWHALPPEAVLTALAGTADGLRGKDVEARRARFGRNLLPEAKRKGLLAVYLGQFMSPFIYLLLAAAGVSLAIGHFADALFIFAVLQLNAVIGTYQEWRAESRAAALKHLVQSWVLVRRDRRLQRLDGSALVPGDIVLVESGLRLPADLRLLDAKELLVDESLLTGESMPVEKHAEPVLPEAAAIGERANMLHAGAVVMSGRGSAAVVETATRTQVGRIAEALTSDSSPKPPLMRRMEQFTRWVALAVVGVVGAIAAVEITQGTPLAEVFLIAVALAVSAIPEGLPVALTVALSISVSRMARRNVVVRLLPAVEGLGACTLIASDKTGTLTLNRLTVTRLWLPGREPFEVRGSLGPHMPEAASRLVLTGALCNEASVGLPEPDAESEAEGATGLVGDTVDVAFLRLAIDLGFDLDDLAERYPEVGKVAYEPSRRFAASFRHQDDHVVAFVKGAAETVLAMCGAFEQAEAEVAVARLAGEGFRVIALAAGTVEAAREGALSGLTLVGLAALIDPLRPEAADAVARCRRAGVEVRMVTGDHPLTALAIARDLGMADQAGEVAVGSDLAALDEAALDAAVRSARVFARIEPLQKLAIVESLRRQGHVVAVTGDGVNDAPALRAADIGVAMGRGGTDIAREASDLTLTDDNFASIVAGIEEGRIAYDNVRKVIFLLITTGAAEIVLFLLAMLAGLPVPLTAVQLLWLNLVTNGIQDVALAFEAGEPGVLDRRPRPKGQAIFDRQMIQQVVLVGLFAGALGFGFYAYALNSGWELAAAQNALLWMLICFENAHAFNARSERQSIFRLPLRSNPLLIGSVFVAQAAHIGAMFTPGLSDVLGIAPLAGPLWLPMALLGFSVLPLVELKKLLGRRRPE